MRPLGVGQRRLQAHLDQRRLRRAPGRRSAPSASSRRATGRTTAPRRSSGCRARLPAQPEPVPEVDLSRSRTNSAWTSWAPCRRSGPARPATCPAPSRSGARPCRLVGLRRTARRTRASSWPLISLTDGVDERARPVDDLHRLERRQVRRTARAARRAPCRPPACCRRCSPRARSACRGSPSAPPSAAPADEHDHRVVAEPLVVALGRRVGVAPRPTSVSVAALGSSRSASARRGREHGDDTSTRPGRPSRARTTRSNARHRARTRGNCDVRPRKLYLPCCLQGGAGRPCDAAGGSQMCASSAHRDEVPDRGRQRGSGVFVTFGIRPRTGASRTPAARAKLVGSARLGVRVGRLDPTRCG